MIVVRNGDVTDVGILLSVVIILANKKGRIYSSASREAGRMLIEFGSMNNFKNIVSFVKPVNVEEN